MDAGTKTELLARPTDTAHAATVRALRALDENARLARRQLLAIDQYVDTMARFLTAGRAGPPTARRHATAQGLHRLKEYLSQRMSQVASPQAARLLAAEPLLVKEQP